MTRLDKGTILRKTGDVPFRIIEGEAVLVNTGTHEVIHLNDTGTFIWENVDGENDIGAIVGALIEEFEVEESAALEDVVKFASDLIEKGLISTSRPDCDPA